MHLTMPHFSVPQKYNIKTSNDDHEISLKTESHNKRNLCL